MFVKPYINAFELNTEAIMKVGNVSLNETVPEDEEG